MTLQLPNNVSTTGLFLGWPQRLNTNHQQLVMLQKISFPLCQSSRIRGDRMVETIAIETSYKIVLILCAFNFQMRSWQGLLDRRRSTTLPLLRLHWIRNGTTLSIKVLGIIPLLGNGMMYPKKPSRTKPKFMLGKSLKFVLKRGANFRWVTPCANSKGARCSRETTSRTKLLMWPCSRSWVALQPTWKLAKLWMHMGQCRGIKPLKGMGNKHTPKR